MTKPETVKSYKECLEHYMPTTQEAQEEGLNIYPGGNILTIGDGRLGIAHVNLTVPRGTLPQAAAFYGSTLGFTSVPVPVLQRETLAWFDITPHGQQIHIAFGENELKSSRHPCFKVASLDALLQLRQKVWEHFERRDDASPREADRPGEEDSGAKGVEYPKRFFARDYAGNRLEFSL